MGRVSRRPRRRGLRLSTGITYGVDDRPPLREAVPLGFQHLMAMLLGNVTPPILIALALGLDRAETTLLLQTALVLSGLATIVQAHPIGPIGGRLPIVMGTSIVFMGAILAIARQYNLATAFGACLAAAAVELVMGAGVVRARQLFPPLVSGIVVVLIGLTLVPIGMDYAAGGVGAEDYGAPVHLGLAALVLVVTLGLNQWTRGFWSYASVLGGVVVGYGVALAMGVVDFAGVGDAGWWALPRPVPFGLELHLGPIALMAVIYAVTPWRRSEISALSSLPTVASRRTTSSEAAFSPTA